MPRLQIAALLFPLLALQGACVWRGALRQDFHQPKGSQTAKVPFRTAVYEGDKMAPQVLQLVDFHANLAVELKLNPGFKSAVTSELSNVFYDVTELEDWKKLGEQEYLAVGLVNGAYVGVFVFDPQVRELIAGYQEALGVGKLPAQSGRRTRELLEKGISEALPRISRRMLEDPKLREYPLRKASAIEAEWEGDQALKTKTARDAYPYYFAALANAYFSTSLDTRIREKYLRTAAELRSVLPDIPAEAFEHSRTATALLRNSEGEDEKIKEGIALLEKAVSIAPWWEIPYHNLAVAYESLEDAASAIRNYEFYLQAAPQAADAAVVRERIMALKAPKS